MNSKQAYLNLLSGLNKLYGLGEARSLAAIVLEDAFGIKHHQINDDTELTPEQINELNKIIPRLQDYEPVQYVLGKTIFFGLPIKVNPDVLIPRQETEELVAWILETVHRPPSTVYRILDVGTGSGCIPIAIKNKMPKLEIHALDVSEAALKVAQENAVLNKTEILFHQVDILNKLAWNQLPKYDLIVSNPPYITEDEKKMMSKNVIDYEPHLALFSGKNDAQRFVKVIVEFAKMHLNKNGLLFFETNEFYAPDSKLIMEEQGFEEVKIKKDLNGKDRMLRGRVVGN